VQEGQKGGVATVRGEATGEERGGQIDSFFFLEENGQLGAPEVGFGFWSFRDEWMDLVGGWAVDRYGPIWVYFAAVRYGT